MLMNVLHTFPNTTLQFYAGDMQLHIKLDTAYLMLPGARRRAAGHFYLTANRTEESGVSSISGGGVPVVLYVEDVGLSECNCDSS